MPGMRATLDEFSRGALHSGSKRGPTVTSRKQAIAIGLSEQRKASGTSVRSSLGSLAKRRAKSRPR